jgi:hypothetical protein
MCPVHSDRTDHTRSTRHVKEDWEELYRAAVLEFDRSRLPQRIEDAEAAIRKRSRNWSKPLSGHAREQDAITRALHILSLLRKTGQEQ